MEKEKEKRAVKYVIAVKTITGKILTYTVDNYSTEDGFVHFKDRYTGKNLKFDGRNCQIEVIVDE